MEKTLIEPTAPRKLQGRMTGPPIDRIPLHVTILPFGIAAWLVVGKVGLGFLALVLAAAPSAT